jgi:sugar phosphate isomerase/epimerase
MSPTHVGRYSRRGILTAAILAGGASLAAKRANKMHFGFTTYQWGREWDIATLIANCTQLKAHGIEMRVEMNSAHGVELTLDPAKRREVKKRFADSPVKVLGLATGERFDFIDPAKLKASIEKAKRYAELSHDIGGRGIRVFPNDFHKEVPQEQTIAQIAKGVNELAKSAAGYGQLIRLENHGTAGRLTTLKAVMDLVDQKNVGVKLNCDARDAADGKFEEKFHLVKGRLADTLHFHDLNATDFPYQLQCNLLMDAGWNGWWLPELDKPPAPPERMAGLMAQRRLWDALIDASLKRAS